MKRISLLIIITLFLLITMVFVNPIKIANGYSKIEGRIISGSEENYRTIDDGDAVSAVLRDVAPGKGIVNYTNQTNEYNVETIFKANMGMFQIHSGDIDGDGLFEANILRNSGGSFFVKYKEGEYEISDVNHNGACVFGDVADTDNDGFAEILAGAYSLEIVSYIPASESFLRDTSIVIEGGVRGLIAGDIKNDGTMRIIAGSDGSGYVHVFKYDNGSYVEEWKDSLLIPGGRIVPTVVGDVNNDDINEFIVNVEGTGELNVYQWNGVTYQKIIQQDIGSFYSPAVIFDLDRDGLNEIIIDAGKISVYKYSSQNNNFEHIWSASDGQINQISVGDIDGDGQDEAVCFFPWRTPGKILVIGYDGVNYVEESEITDFPDGLGGGTVADFNGDGLNEIITSLFNVSATEYPIFLVTLDHCSIFVDSPSAFQNDTIIVDINVDFTEGSTFSSSELSFGGFHGSLEFVEVDTSNTLIGTAGWDVYVNDTDTLLITASGGSNNISGEGTLFRLKFYVPGSLSPGFIPITVEQVLFDETDLYINIVNGGVNVLNPTFYGDVSLNGEVRAYDASLILKYLVGVEELNSQQLLNANVSLDTSVSSLDASLIFQYVVGLIDTLPYDTTMESLLASGNIAMNDGKIQSGQQIDVPLLLTGGENILSFEGLIKFNPDHLSFNEIVWSDLLADFTIELNEDNGNIKIAGAGSVPDGQEGLFASIHFTVDDNFKEAETVVEVKRLRLNEEAVMENVASAVLTNTVGINGDQSNIPKEYALQQNFPNPFNPTTTISFQIPKSSFVKLTIYDVNGRLIETLVNENKNVGYYTVGWNANKVCSGIYFYRIDAGEFTCVKKCLVVK